jgi:DNA-binding NarL/FixJ family response regulator
MKDTKFLIVEDDELTREVLKKTLLGLNYKNIITCSNGFEAIEIIRAETIDICIMDIELNDKLDGVDTAKIIGGKTKVIFASSHKESDTFKRISEASSHGFLSKPITSQMLQQAVDLALSASN